MRDRGRAIRNVIAMNLDEMWDSMRANKQNELTMLNQEVTDQRTEASRLKTALIELGGTVPDVEKTASYGKASALPIASVGNNLTMAEEMLEYQTGKVDAYTEAIQNFRSGMNLMGEVETDFMGAESQLTPLGENAPYEADMLQWTNPEAYRDYLLEGGMLVDADGGVTFPGSEYDDETTTNINETSLTEMEQLYQSLPDAQKEQLTNDNFREGFLAGKTLRKDAEISVANRIKTEQDLLKIRNEMKEATLADIDRLRTVFQATKNKLGGELSPSVVLGGQSLQLAGLSLQAGDVEKWSQIMTAISDDKSLKSIMPEVSTLINGTISATQDDPYGAYIKVVSGAYQEYLDIISLGDKWEDQFGIAAAKQMIADAKKKGTKSNNIPPGFEEEYGQMFHLLTRHNAFNKSGILTDNQADLTSILMIDSMDHELTDTEISFLGMRGRSDIEDFYARGPLGGKLDEFEDELVGVYDADHPEFDKESFELQQAHLEWIKLQGNLPDPSQDEVVEEIEEIERLNDNSTFRSKAYNSFKTQRASLVDFVESWDESLGGIWTQTQPLRGRQGPSGEMVHYQTFGQMMDGLPSRSMEGTVLSNRKGTPAGTFGSNVRHSTTGSSMQKKLGDTWDGLMFMNDTEVLLADLIYLDQAVADQLWGLSSEQAWMETTGTFHGIEWLGAEYGWKQMPVEDRKWYAKEAYDFYVDYAIWRSHIIDAHKAHADADASGAYSDQGGVTGVLSGANYKFDPVAYQELLAYKLAGHEGGEVVANRWGTKIESGKNLSEAAEMIRVLNKKLGSW